MYINLLRNILLAKNHLLRYLRSNTEKKRQLDSIQHSNLCLKFDIFRDLFARNLPIYRYQLS